MSETSVSSSTRTSFILRIQPFPSLSDKPEERTSKRIRFVIKQISFASHDHHPKVQNKLAVKSDNDPLHVSAPLLNPNHDTPPQDAATDWPSYTTLFRGHSGEFKLTAQTHEVRAIVRLAIRSVLAKVCFLDFFPLSATRAAWHMKTLTAAAIRLRKTASQKNALVANRYEKLQERLRADEDYVPTLGKVVRPDFRSLGPH